jgi:hypothetical protein
MIITSAINTSSLIVTISVSLFIVATLTSAEDSTLYSTLIALTIFFQTLRFFALATLTNLLRLNP